MLNDTRGYAKAIFVVSTVFTVTLLGLYIGRRDKNIPLTYSTPFTDWGSVRDAVRAGPTNLTWPRLANLTWCSAPSAAPLCHCLAKHLSGPYTNNTREFMRKGMEPAQLAEAVFDDLIDACMRARPVWKKETCDGVCTIHLATPPLLACLASSLFLSRVSVFSSHFLSSVAYYAPLVLALLAIVFQLVLDLTGGILPSLAVVAMVVEISYLSPCQDGATAFWSGWRYVATMLALYAAVAHQARDVFLVTAYGFLGMLLGVLAYFEFLVQCRSGSHTARVLGLFAWVGIGCITGALLLLVQQQWLPRSPVTSSVASVVALFGFCAQCLLSYAPRVSDRLQMCVGLLLLAVCFVATAMDVA